MEKARYNTELYSNLRGPLNNVKPSNFLGSHHMAVIFFYRFVCHVVKFCLHLHCKQNFTFYENEGSSVATLVSGCRVFVLVDLFNSMSSVHVCVHCFS